MHWILIAFFKLFGWKVSGNWPDIPKYIVAVGPHTSTWDFPMGLALRAVTNNYKAKYLGKHTLFHGPVGWFMRKSGGYPVDRTKRTGLVDAVIDLFNQADELVIGIAPEGTRKKVEKLKTGFWYIAKGANIPIVMVGFDYGTRTCIIKPPLTPTDLETDINTITNFYRSVKAKNPALSV